MNRCRVHVGRLIEVRAESGYRSEADVDAIFAEIGKAVEKVPDEQKIVIVIDWRRCPVMSSEASERMLPAIMATNPRLERSATIASKDSPTAIMQFVRLIRESNHPNRRLFFETNLLEQWLSEILSPAEAERLHAFLDYQEP